MPAEENNPRLVEHIAGEIAASGPMTFRRFMELALYHPEHGYYNARAKRLGRDGDYYTSPAVHPVFGRLIADQLEEMWRSLGSPAEFHVVEPGAGEGWLCADVTRAAAKRPEFAAALRWFLCDRSPAMAEAQRRTLAESPLRSCVVARPFDDIPDDSVEGCFLSNELFDALPVHRVRMRGGALREIFVDRENDAFVERESDPSTPELEAYFKRLGIQLEDGQEAEINLDAVAFIGRVADKLRRGFVMTIDYGYEAHKLYAPHRMRGSLMCYHRHAISEDPLARVGEQDITTHVDFTTLMQAGEAAGLAATGLTNQAFFLLSLGLPEAMNEETLEAMTPADALRHSAALKRLISPDGLGGFRVLIQHKGMENPELRGLAHRP